MIQKDPFQRSKSVLSKQPSIHKVASTTDNNINLSFAAKRNKKNLNVQTTAKEDSDYEPAEDIIDVSPDIQKLINRKKQAVDMMSKLSEHFYKTLEMQPKLKNLITTNTVKL